jgi:Ribosomal protein L11 methyltransferase (PrmA)/Arginine methyltransferase oligomerization subdomain
MPPVEEHRAYLSDRIRLRRFRAAIREVVKPGDVVMDLGAGTGILGLLACEAGAARVYAVEAGGMIEAAREIARANGRADRIVHLKGLSTEIELPEAADVVVADQLGHFGIEAGVTEFFRDARRRHLRRAARAIPSRVELFVAPVNVPRLWRRIDFWRSRPAGFDCSPLLSIARNTISPAVFTRRDFLGAPVAIATLDLLAGARRVRGEVRINVARAGTLHGLCGFFRARLSRSVTMTNSPLARDRIDRQAAFFPLTPPVEVHRGERIAIAMSMIPERMLVAWKVAISDRRGKVRARFGHSTLGGMLIAAEDLLKTRPTFAPRLTRRGEARRAVMNLIDGRRTIAEIERALPGRYRNLFASAAEPASLIAAVVACDTIDPRSR